MEGSRKARGRLEEGSRKVRGRFDEDRSVAEAGAAVHAVVDLDNVHLQTGIMGRSYGDRTEIVRRS